MSSSRAANSAKMKRASDFKQAPSFQQGQQQQPGQLGQPGQRSMPQPPPKMLISDAIALISLRLGKVETILQTFENENANDSILVNYDDVFEEILERLSKVEEANLNQPSQQPQQQVDTSNIERDVASLKDVVMKLQLMTIETNQKIASMVLSNSISEQQLQIIPQPQQHQQQQQI